MEPVCYDTGGSATTLLARILPGGVRAQGLPEDEVRRRIEAAYRDGRLGQAQPHFMLYAPFATQEDLGGLSGPHMPVVVWPGRPDALIIIMAHDSNRR